MQRGYFAICVTIFAAWTISAQSTDQQRLINALLDKTPIDDDLRELCDQIGGRVTGSEANVKSIDWAYEKFLQAGVEVKKQRFEMPVLWLEKSTTSIIRSKEIVFEPAIVSKYQSPPGRYTSSLVYIEDPTKFDGSIDIRDKFILAPTELCLDIDGLFAEYAWAYEFEQLADKYGALGIVFISSRPQKLLYSFISSKGSDNDMPQFVMAREDAERCMRLLESGESLEITIEIDAETGGSFVAENVIAEIEGKSRPEEVIIIGAHIDSWSLGTGANDNGCNVSMMIDIARQMKKLEIQPERTIRFALWNGEEQGYFGSWAYTRDYESELDNHKLAISIDIGSGQITGFFTNGMEGLMGHLEDLFSGVLDDRTLHHLNIPIIGTDNFDFMLQGVPNLVAIHKPQVYGINYHAASDTYDKVDIATLKENTGLVATLILLYANSSYDLPRQSRSEVMDLLEKGGAEFPMRMFNVWDDWVEMKRGIKK